MPLQRVISTSILTSYLLGMAVLYLPHSHEDPVALKSAEVKTTSTKKHSHNHHHSHNHAHHRHDKSDKQCDSKDKKHSHHHHHHHDGDDDCLLCQFQMQPQDNVAIVMLPPVSEVVATLVIASPLSVHPPLLGISQSRAPPIV